MNNHNQLWSRILTADFPDHYPVWRHACASVRVRPSKSSGLLSRGFGSRPLFLQRHVSRPAVRYSLDFPQSSPSRSRDAPRLPLLRSLLQRCFRSTAGAAILRLSSLSDVGGTSSIRPGQSVCLLSHRPSPNENPAFSWQWRVPSGLPAS